MHAANDTQGFARAYHLGSQLISVGAGSVALFLIAFSDVVLDLWTRDPALSEHTSVILRILLFGNLLNGLLNMPWQAQLAYRWTGLALRAECIAVIVVVPAILWATPRYGMAGAGWAWVGLNAGYVLIVTHFMYRRILGDERWIWYRDDILFPLLPAALIAFSSRQILMASTSGSIEYWGVFVLGAALTFLAACVAAPLVRRAALDLKALYLPQFMVKR